MHKLILQAQLLLTALSALLPFAPEAHRARIADMLTMVAQALAAGASVSANLDDLTAKLAVIRADVERIAEAGRDVSESEFDAALTRVRAASVAFRAAVDAAGTRA